MVGCMQVPMLRTGFMVSLLLLCQELPDLVCTYMEGECLSCQAVRVRLGNDRESCRRGFVAPQMRERAWRGKERLLLLLGC